MEKIQKINLKTLLGVAVAAAIACVCLIPKVNVNSDMTKYLPDDSQMRHGIEVITEEIDASSLNMADARIMMKGVPSDSLQAIADSISAFKGINGVSVRTAGEYALYEMGVAHSVNQKRLARRIGKTFEHYEAVTQTSQDGNTPDPIALVLAVSVLVVILLIMSTSWMEPVLFLAVTGMAVGVNVGTNAFLNSVSITTNSIAAVLQLALSMDYSIILMNRFRQERIDCEDSVSAMWNSLKKAAPSILSSAMTTVVGLLMLAFMNLKIGADLGFVLAKGVLCSLLYVFIALPGLILIFEKAIDASEKKVPELPTDKIAAYNEKHKVPLALISVIVFVGFFLWSEKTEITFSTNVETPIDQIFTKKNTVVLVYDNADENAVIDIVDSIAGHPEVDMAISYPSLMLKKHNVTEMTDMLKKLGGEQAEMLSEDLLRIVYYSCNSGEKESMKVSFPDLLAFVEEQAQTNELVAANLPEDFQEKMEMLHSILPDGDEPAVASAPKAAPAVVTYVPSSQPVETAAPAPVESSPAPAAQPTAMPRKRDVTKPLEANGKMNIREYMVALAAQERDPEISRLATFTDRKLLNTKMNVDEMTSYMGSTKYQTKMVYSFSKNKDAGMTPLEFTHFLADDLFSRKALASMVSAEQKAGLRLRLKVMEYANRNADVSIEELDEIAVQYGAKSALKRTAPPIDGTTSVSVVSRPVVPVLVETPKKETVADDVPAQAEVVTVVTPAPEEPQEDPRIARLMRMMNPARKYTAEQMGRNFAALGNPVDKNTMGLLYMLYGSAFNYDESWEMNLSQLVDFIGENVINGEQFSAFVDEDLKEQFAGMQEQMQSGLGKLKGESHSLAVFQTTLPDESFETENFLKGVYDLCDDKLEEEHWFVGESVMFLEMKEGFRHEMLLVTILTILAIFSIVALTFRNLVVAIVLVMTVMSAMFINVTAGGIGGHTVLYLAYLVVQSILMGATIDYGILFASYYRETGTLKQAYRNSIHTIMTSGLIMICVPGIMAIVLDDKMIKPIVSSLSIGAFAAVALILLMMPGVLAALERIVRRTAPKLLGRKR